MTEVVPLSAEASQNFAISLDGQAVQISIYQLGVGQAASLYMDLINNDVAIFTGRIVRAYGNVPNTRAPFMLAGAYYEPFEGDLLFIDTLASLSVPVEDPQADGLGDRWQLVYYSMADLLAAGLA